MISGVLGYYRDKNEALAVETAIAILWSKNSARNCSVTMTTTLIVSSSISITLCQCCEVARCWCKIAMDRRSRRQLLNLSRGLLNLHHKQWARQ